MVTCHQAGSSGGGGTVLELRALPGEVVVAEDRRPSGEQPRQHPPGLGVDRQRAAVLDDDEVGVLEGRSKAIRQFVVRDRRYLPGSLVAAGPPTARPAPRPSTSTSAVPAAGHGRDGSAE